MSAEQQSRNQNQISPRRHGDTEVARRKLLGKSKIKKQSQDSGTQRKAGEHGKKNAQKISLRPATNLIVTNADQEQV
jgi:type II secretory pathway component GspD/PulD (secretin)